MKNPEFNFMLENKNKYIKYYPKFSSIFGVSLKRYWDNMFGFDVVKFDDEFIKAPDGISTAQAIEEKYGKDAVELIRILI